MRINNGTRAKKSRSTGVKKARKAGAFNPRAVVIGVACFLGVATIIGVSASSRPSSAARLDAPSDYAAGVPNSTSASKMNAADSGIAGTTGHEPEAAAGYDPPPELAPPAQRERFAELVAGVRALPDGEFLDADALAAVLPFEARRPPAAASGLAPS